LPMGKEVFWWLTLNHRLIHAVMKDPDKNASKLISTDMKERKTVKARDGVRRGKMGGHLLTFLRAGIIKGLMPVICSALCLNMQSWSWDSICQWWLGSNMNAFWMFSPRDCTKLGVYETERSYWECMLKL